MTNSLSLQHQSQASHPALSPPFLDEQPGALESSSTNNNTNTNISSKPNSTVRTANLNHEADLDFDIVLDTSSETSSLDRKVSGYQPQTLNHDSITNRKQSNTINNSATNSLLSNNNNNNNNNSNATLSRSHSVTSLSRSLSKQLSHNIKSIKDAVRDDNQQTLQEHESKLQNFHTAYYANMEDDIEQELQSRKHQQRQLSTSRNTINVDCNDTGDYFGPDSENNNNNNGNHTSNNTKTIHQTAEEESDLELQNEKSYSAKVTEEDEIPDGGIAAWMSAIAALMLVTSSWGSNSSYGVFLQYYLNNDTFHGASEYDFALIGCIVVFLAQALAPFALLFVPMIGFKPTLVLGMVFQFAGYILASFATNIWQLYLTQGVLVGISFSLLFIPGSIVIPQWFSSKRAVANGIVSSGAGLGGIVFSLSVNKIIERSGDQRWALRYLALATCFLSGLATLMIRNRTFKKQKVTKKYFVEQFKTLFDWTIIKEYPPLTIGFWFGFVFLAYSMELFTLSDFGTSVGLTAHQGSVLTAIFNLGQFFGRPALGLVADRLGRINFTILCCIFNLILLYAFWINATNYGSLIAFSLISGCSMGVGSLMMQPLSADNISSSSKFPASYSLVNIIVGIFSLPSEVIMLALRDKKSNKPYLHAQIFGGLCIVVGILIITSLREWKIRKVLSGRLIATIKKLEEYEADEKRPELETEYTKKPTRSGEFGEKHRRARLHTILNTNNTRAVTNNLSDEQNNGKNEIGAASVSPNDVHEKDNGNTEDGKDTKELLLKRKQHYGMLLKPSLLAFVARILYPMKV